MRRFVTRILAAALAASVSFGGLWGTAGAAPSPTAPRLRLVAGAAGWPAGGERVHVRGPLLLAPGRLAPEALPESLSAPGLSPQPAVVRPTAFHPDGSVRAAVVDAQVPARLLAAGAELALLAARPAKRPRLAITETPTGVTVDTGAVSLVLPREGPRLIDAWRIGRTPVLAGESMARLLAYAGDGPIEGCVLPREVGVERCDALVARVAVRGFLAGADLEPRAAYQLVLEARADSAVLGFELDVAGLSDHGLADDLALELSLAAGADARFGFLGGGGRAGREGHPLRGRGGRVLALDGAGVVGGAERAVVALDPAARCGIVAWRPGLAWGCGVARLRPHAPRAVELEADGRLRFVLIAGPFLLDDDLRSFAAGALGAAPRAQAAALAAVLGREDTVTLLGLDEAVLALAPDAPLPAARGDDAVAAAAARLLARVHAGLDRVAGQRDHGDLRLGEGFSNLEYDPAAAFALGFAGSGDALLRRGLLDMLGHWLRHDVSRGEAGIPEGLPFQHGDDHRSGTYEAGHVWSGGLVFGAMLEGDPRMLAAAEALRRGLIAELDLVRQAGAERAYGWTLRALQDLSLLRADAATDAAVSQVLDELLARQDPQGFFAIDAARPGDAAYAVTPWVTGGITCDALHRAAVAGDPRAAAALARAAEYLAARARRADGVFAARVFHGPRLENGIGRDGRADPVDELLACAGLSRALLHEEHPAVRAALDERLVPALDAAAARGMSPHEACRALVALRALAGVSVPRSRD